MQAEIKKIFLESIEVKKKFLSEDNLNKLDLISKLILNCLKKGGKVLICGNGGSASDAEHFAAELVGRFKKERKAMAALALTTDTSILTSISNDYSFKNVFSRQIEALGKKGDTLIAISTSGNSENILEALKAAKKLKIKTIGFLGKDGGEAKKLADVYFIVSSDDTARIQETHITAIHAVAEIIENDILKDTKILFGY